MKVILLNKVSGLGILGDEVDVKTGYARNFLIPRGKAILATKKNIEYFKLQQDKLAAKSVEVLSIARDRAEKINSLISVTIKSKVGSEGKLFGSVGTRDIVEAMNKAGVKVFKNEIRLPNGVLRTTGEHEVSFQIHREIVAKVIVKIISE